MSEARSGTLSEPQVQAMFDRIASVYDLMNSVMTVGLHHRWRSRAADMAGVGPGDRALDVASGTGDLAVGLGARAGADGEGIGSGFSQNKARPGRPKGPAFCFPEGKPPPPPPPKTPVPA